MISAHVVAAIIGIALSLAIIYLVRKDHISPRVAARWFLVSLLVLGISLQPQIVDWVGAQLGIGYPPILPMLVAISVAMIKILIMDIERQKMQVRIDRLVQKLAIVEQAVKEEKIADNSHSNSTTSNGKIINLKKGK